MLPKRNIWVADDLKVELLTWSGKKEDEEELRAFCGDQLNYVRDDGIASIGAGEFITDFMVSAGDLVLRDADEERPMLRLTGDHWLVQAMLGFDKPQEEPEQPDA
jgi:hypothetical protein